MDDSGERKQYSKMGIFGRIYQHSTTREQKAFILNHHHTTTSDNSRLSKNTPRPRIRVHPERNNTTTIQLHLTTADYQRIYQDPVSEFFLNKRTQIYARGVHQERFFSSFEQHKIQDPPAPCSKEQEARGLHPDGWTFFKKAHTTRRSKEALHGFTQESTRTTLVPTRQDLKEQGEASRTQPWSARGLVGVGPTGYPARKGEDLVWLGFFPYNLSSSIIL